MKCIRWMLLPGLAMCFLLALLMSLAWCFLSEVWCLASRMARATRATRGAKNAHVLQSQSVASKCPEEPERPSTDETSQKETGESAGHDEAATNMGEGIFTPRDETPQKETGESAAHHEAVTGKGEDIFTSPAFQGVSLRMVNPQDVWMMLFRCSLGLWMTYLQTFPEPIYIAPRIRGVAQQMVARATICPTATKKNMGLECRDPWINAWRDCCSAHVFCFLHRMVGRFGLFANEHSENVRVAYGSVHSGRNWKPQVSKLSAQGL